MSLNCPQCHEEIFVDTPTPPPKKLRCSQCQTSLVRFGFETVTLVCDSKAVTYLRAGFRNWCKRNRAGVIAVGLVTAVFVAAYIQLRLSTAEFYESKPRVKINLSKEQKKRQQELLKEIHRSNWTENSQTLTAHGLIGRDAKEFSELIKLAEAVSGNERTTGKSLSFNYEGVDENDAPRLFHIVVVKSRIAYAQFGPPPSTW